MVSSRSQLGLPEQSQQQFDRAALTTPLQVRKRVTAHGALFGELGLSEVLRLADLGDRATEVLGRSHDMARSVPANRGTPRTAGDSGGNIPVQL